MIEAAKKFMDTYSVPESQILQDIPSKTVFRCVIPLLNQLRGGKVSYITAVFTFVEMNGEGKVMFWTDDIVKISPQKLSVAQEKIISFNEHLGADIAHIDADNDARIKIISNSVNSDRLFERANKIYLKMTRLADKLYNELTNL